MAINVQKLAPYAKTVVAVLGVLILLANAALDGSISVDELQQVGIAAAAALGVYQIPNKKV